MPASTERVILNSSLVTLASTVGFSIAPKKYGGNGELPPARLLIGTSLAFLGLSILGDIAPEIAKPLSAAVAITAVTYYGFPVLDNYFNDRTGYEAKVKTGKVAGPPSPTPRKEVL
jgi:hypothetical protein